MKNTFERMGRRVVSLLVVVCLMLGMVGTAFASEKEDAKDAVNTAVDMFKDGATIKDKAEVVKEIAHGIIDNYEDVYELAYGYAKESGYVKTADWALTVAIIAIDDAIAYVDAQELDAEIKAMVIAELKNTQDTIAKIAELLVADKFNTIDAAWETILSLKDVMHGHRDALIELGVEVGLELDPYIMAVNDAVVAYVDMVNAIADEIVAEIAAREAAYAAFADEVVALADIISPELSAAVRKFFDDSAADIKAIVEKYAEEGLAQLFIAAAEAAGDVMTVAAALDATLALHGEVIYNALKDNAEVAALAADIEAQLENIEAIADALYNSSVEAAVEDVYGELVYLYENALPVVLNAVAALDDEAACALEDALEALSEALSVVCDSADGYLGWLADHAAAMNCELLCAILDNLYELIITACPIMDQWMYDWLYNNPDVVIGFVSENAEEIQALVEKFGPAVVGVLSYIAVTYGDDVAEFVMDDPCGALDMFMKWYNKYGYRVWPMVDVYLEALGVYDAIENEITNLLGQVDAHILAQIAALQAALDDANSDIAAAIKAEIAALKAFLKSKVSTTYFVTSDSYYVALGDADAYGVAADLLAAELGVAYANLTTVNAVASDVLAALNAAEIAKADLITLGFSANAFTAAVAKDVLAAVGFDGTVSEKNWNALVGAKAAAAIDAALAELNAYVTEQIGDADIAALLTMVVEGYAYGYISHLINYVTVSEAIHEINAEALLVLVGMHNPMDGAVIDLNGETLDLGEYLDYLVTLTNVFSFVYALHADETIYVDAADVDLAYDGSVMGAEAFLVELMNMAYGAGEKFIPNEAGYEYIQEQIYNALNPVFVDEDVECQHAFGGESTIVWNWTETEKGWECSAYYRCAKCGEKIVVACTVNAVVTKQPTVEEEGEATYTATAVIEGQAYTNTKTVTLAKLPAGPDTGDTMMVGLYVTMALLAAAAGVVVLKKKAA